MYLFKSLIVAFSCSHNLGHTIFKWSIRNTLKPRFIEALAFLNLCVKYAKVCVSWMYFLGIKIRYIVAYKAKESH